MAFNSLEFFLYFIVVFFVYWLLASPARQRWRLMFLLAASYFFYSRWNVKYLALIIGVTLINYVAALGMDAAKKREAGLSLKAWLMLAISGSLLLLVGFKYFNFFAESLSAALDYLGYQWAPPVSKLLLPIGISFYVFQSLSYSIDVYRGQFTASRSFRDFALYVSFFPQLVSGPIIRAKVLMDQLQADPKVDLEQIKSGLFQVLGGLFKKFVIADVLAQSFVDQAFSDPANMGMPLAWLAMYGYAIQLYCDFSGYTDVAIGCSKMMGIEIPANFDRPYTAVNLRDFWRRWHISLSTWLRDYLYVSLGGNRKGPQRMYFAIMVTMVLGGLWHGASWTFVAWGALHGVFLVVNRLLQNMTSTDAENKPVRAPVRFLKQVVTFHLVALALVVFRSDSIGAALEFFTRMATGATRLGPIDLIGIPVLLLGYGLHFSPLGWKERLRQRFAGLPVYLQAAVVVLVLLALIIMAPVSMPFLYFQF